MGPSTIILVAVIGILLFSLVLWFFSRYKKCPSDKVMVIYGRVGKNVDGTTRSAKCIHGGAAFIVPVKFRRSRNPPGCLCRQRHREQ